MMSTPHPQRTRVGSVVHECWNGSIEHDKLIFTAFAGDSEHVVAEVLSPTCVRTTRNHVLKSWIVVTE